MPQPSANNKLPILHFLAAVGAGSSSDTVGEPNVHLTSLPSIAAIIGPRERLFAVWSTTVIALNDSAPNLSTAIKYPVGVAAQSAFCFCYLARLHCCGLSFRH